MVEMNDENIQYNEFETKEKLKNFISEVIKNKPII